VKLLLGLAVSAGGLCIIAVEMALSTRGNDANISAAHGCLALFAWVGLALFAGICLED